MLFKTKNGIFSITRALLLLAALAGVYRLYHEFGSMVADGRIIITAADKSAALAALSLDYRASGQGSAATRESAVRNAYYDLGRAISEDLSSPYVKTQFKALNADYYALGPMIERLFRTSGDENARAAAWKPLHEKILRMEHMTLAAATSNNETRNLLLATTGMLYLSLFVVMVLMEAVHYHLVTAPLFDGISALRRKIMRCAAPFPGRPAPGDEIEELMDGTDALRDSLVTLSEDRLRLKREAETRQLRMKAQSRSLELTRKKVIALVEDLEEARTDLQKEKKALKEAGEKLERSNRELEQFAYVASHDLKEPLRIVSSFTALLAKRYAGRLDGDADDFIHYIIEGSQRASDLISALFNYSKVTYTTREFRPVAVETALQKAMFNLKISIEEKNAAIKWEDLPRIKGDEFQLIQLFQNLISNSLKFNSAPEPEIHVTASGDGDMNVIRFSDNGIGIAPEHFDRIFLIFQRLHSQEKYPGTGIGLALCKKIAENHGGRIWVESKPGEGSVFCMQFPSPPPEPAAEGSVTDKAGVS